MLKLIKRFIKYMSTAGTPDVDWDAGIDGIQKAHEEIEKRKQEEFEKSCNCFFCN